MQRTRTRQRHKMRENTQNIARKESTQKSSAYKRTDRRMKKVLKPSSNSVEMVMDDA
jgi:hypothetical protein